MNSKHSVGPRLVALGLLVLSLTAWAGVSQAQIAPPHTPLYFFGGPDGANPYASLTQGKDGNLYGTTFYGGTGDGSVFKITTSGAFTTLYSFTGGADGALPYAGLIQGKDGNLYGTTSFGGANNDGTVFKITASGAFTTLYSFSSADGGTSNAGLIPGHGR